MIEEIDTSPQGQVEEKIKAVGEVHIELSDAEGNILADEKGNLVVNSGLAFFASRVLGNSTAVISHIAVGTVATAPAKTQTSVLAEVARQAITSAVQGTTTVANDAAVYAATLGPGVGTGALTELGLFNAATGGTMVARVVFPVINKGANDTLTVSWKITFI